MNPWLIGLILFLVLTDLAIRVACLFVVPRNRRPNSANAWLLTIFFLPFIGWFLFLLIGSYKLPRSRRKKQNLISEVIAKATAQEDETVLDAAAPPWLGPLVKLNRQLGSMPMVGNNRVDIFTDTKTIMEHMIATINSAKKKVHVQFYIISLDHFTENFFVALENAHRRKVKVRVLYDHIATLRTPNYFRMKARLKRNGIEFYPLLPVQLFKLKYQRPDLRNHRKLLVVDDKVAFIGSLNVIDPAYNTKGDKKMIWQDSMLRIVGPVVSGISAVFVSDWYSETDQLLKDYRKVYPGSGDVHCQVVPSGPGFEGENNLQMFLTLLYSAQKQIVITSPYFVPDEAMSLAISSATKRGVNVELFLSESHDQKIVYHAQCSYYEELLRAGVKIWLYRAPNFLHSKYMTIDDQVAVLGSSNFDMRSFNLNMELSLLSYGRDFVSQLRSIEAVNRQNSYLLSLRDWLRRSRLDRLKDNLARLTSSLQ